MALQPEAVIIQAVRSPGRDTGRTGGAGGAVGAVAVSEAAVREVVVLMAAVVRAGGPPPPPAFTNRERPRGTRTRPA
ncbi:hypothetical protein GCM10010357_48130 [Streptomyces luteireticuli]|uniref:Uncharacterized protein n=1 Tax=Streptomyces luteireticuli TaxID=173858 RepID=A0ABP3IRZ2_9ACTN